MVRLALDSWERARTTVAQVGPILGEVKGVFTACGGRKNILHPFPKEVPVHFSLRPV